MFTLIPGDKVKCIKDVKMDTGDVLYLKGKIYICEVQDCLTNEDGTKTHYWTDDLETLESFKEHFVLVNKNKKLYYENNQ